MAHKVYLQRNSNSYYRLRSQAPLQYDVATCETSEAKGHISQALVYHRYSVKGDNCQQLTHKNISSYLHG